MKIRLNRLPRHTFATRPPVAMVHPLVERATGVKHVTINARPSGRKLPLYVRLSSLTDVLAISSSLERPTYRSSPTRTAIRRTSSCRVRSDHDRFAGQIGRREPGVDALDAAVIDVRPALLDRPPGVALCSSPGRRATRASTIGRPPSVGEQLVATLSGWARRQRSRRVARRRDPRFPRRRKSPSPVAPRRVPASPCTSRVSSSARQRLAVARGGVFRSRQRRATSISSRGSS